MSGKHVNIGLLAHVDAGKTTLSEALLYRTGQIRQPGRVDHMDSFMDTDEIERERGITIFSSQACISDGDFSATLLDTPGHVDFSAEMERTLKVIDYAILVISGTDGVQSHTRTLWKLLAHYDIPVFLFINKMDLPGAERAGLMKSLKKELHEGCMDFGALTCGAESGASAGTKIAGSEFKADADFFEELAVLSEPMLNEYMETGSVSADSIRHAIRARLLFPCYFGSALKLFGVDELIRGLKEFTDQPAWPEVFSAKVYKIGRDPKGVRLTFLKMTGGSLKVKDVVPGSGAVNSRVTGGGLAGASPDEGASGAENEPTDQSDAGEAFPPEKVDEIRIYSGAKYETVSSVRAGEICAVTGLSRTWPGMGLGREPDDAATMLEPVMVYQLLPPADVSPIQMAQKCRQLVEEDPMLRIEWNEELGELNVRLMGEVQLEVLTRRIWDRFGIHVSFGPGDIVYKETIAKPVEGVGHFEPLRHYAEVHVLIEPGEPGSGIQVSSACSTDVLDGTKQRMIAMHLKEHEHRGVLTGSLLTDVKFTILTGRAHPKHTQGGDFRKATWRAVRHGLKCTESVLLEPYYRFLLDLPVTDVGRAITDLDQRFSRFGTPEYIDPAPDGTQMSRITGTGPVSTLWDYPRQVHSYTNGIGSMSCELSGYDVCHNSEEVIAKRAYDSEADTKNPTGSVFCAHGAGFPVPWYDVTRFMHLPPAWNPAGTGGKDASGAPEIQGGPEGFGSPDGAGSGGSGGGDGSAAPAADGYAYRTEGRSFSSDSKRGPASFEERVASMKEVDLEAKLADVYAREFGMSITDLNAERYRRGDSGGAGAGSESGSGRTSAGGAKKSGGSSAPKVRHDRNGNPIYPKPRQTEEYLIVDGYNVIFAWEELRELSRANIDAARDRLNDILLNYQSWRKIRVLVVYDAYRVRGGAGHTEVYTGAGPGKNDRDVDVHSRKEKPGIDTTDGLIVAFTRADETADAFIERTVNQLGKKYRVSVVSGDGLIQLTILGLGALRVTAENLKEEIDRCTAEIRQHLEADDHE